MSRSEHPGRNAIVVRLVLAVPLVVVGLVLQDRAPGNMGNGFLTGGLVALVGFGLATWRSSRDPESATTFERAFTQLGDERDDAVLTRALAVLGITAVPLTGVAAIALALGADTPMVMALLLAAQLGVGAVAFLRVNRTS